MSGSSLNTPLTPRHLEAAVLDFAPHIVRGRLHPTAEAQLLYEEVNRSLVGIERIARTAHAIRTQQRGALNVAAPPSIALSLMPRAIASFLKESSEIKVTLGVYDSRTIVDMVIGQRCDVGIVNLAISNTGTHGDSLLSIAHVCTVPVGHRLSGHELIVPADIDGEIFLAHPGHLGTRLLIDAMFAAHGVTYQPAQVETQTAAAICSLVASGQGIALVDAITAMEYKGGDLSFIPFKPSIPLEFSVLRPLRTLPSKLVDRFISHVRNFAIAELDPHLVMK